MFCPSCGVAVQAGQKFCTECGAAVAAVVDAAATQAVPAAPDRTPPSGMPLPPPPVAAGTPAAYEATSAFTVVEQTSHGAAGHITPPAGYPVTPDTGETAVVGPHPFRMTPLVAVALLAGIVAVAAATLDFVGSELVGSGVRDSMVMNDFGTSHLVGAIVGAVVMVVGAVLGATGRRFGTGLAGGAGLALAGMLGFACGMGISYTDAMLHIGEGLPAGQSMEVTYDIGFILAIVAAVLGGVAFFLSMKEMGGDGRPPVPVAIGVLGALGAVAVVVGTLLPGDGASFADNFEMSAIPPATMLLRLLVLVLILLGGVLGFLTPRRWGLGMALGSISVGAWMWITAIAEAGDIPFGIAGGNIGAPDVTPHIVTTIGVVEMVVAALVGLVAVSQQRAGQ